MIHMINIMILNSMWCDLAELFPDLLMDPENMLGSYNSAGDKNPSGIAIWAWFKF